MNKSSKDEAAAEAVKWRDMLQAIGNAESAVLAVYRASGERGGWADGNDPQLRPEVARLAREAGPTTEIDPVWVAELTRLADDVTQRAVLQAKEIGIDDLANAIAELQGLGHDGRAIDTWRDVRRSVRFLLDAATDRAGVPRVPPASVQVRTGPKTGRNAQCPCGSGKKYKKCCLLN